NGISTVRERGGTAQLRQELPDGDAHVGIRQEPYRRGGDQAFGATGYPTVGRVGVRGRVPVDLQDPVDPRDDPVGAHSAARVEAGLRAPIEGEARLGYFDDERGRGRMSGLVVRPHSGNYGEIWLRF